MRMLKFAVEGQQLAKRGDFAGVTAGSKGYLRCHFEQSDPEWLMAKKIAVFNDEYTLWSIADKTGCYEITDGGVKSDPADQPKPEPTLKEKLEALQEDNKTLKEENTMIKQCLMEMSEIVYA